MLDRCSIYGDPGFWIRRAYKEIFDVRNISAVVRLGDRSDPGHKNHIPAGVSMPVRFIERAPTVTEAAVLGKKGLLLPDDGTTFERTECLVRRIDELTADDLAGTAPDTATPELVRYHLAYIGDCELPPWDAVVTIWRFRFLPNVTE